VGYTNAGKSTLFNSTTDGGAYADDKLFATLSTRTRRWGLGTGETVMLSDTVGFVRDIPHHLVASFRATLEEAVHSQLLLIVLDLSHPMARRQLETVYGVLDDIGATRQERVLVLNKIDRLEHNAELLVFEREHPGCIAISAKAGTGLDLLRERVQSSMRGPVTQVTLDLDTKDSRAIHYIETCAEVIDRQYDDGRVRYSARIGSRQLDRVRAMCKNPVHCEMV
jgi:GTP-binding protein HflX